MLKSFLPCDHICQIIHLSAQSSCVFLEVDALKYVLERWGDAMSAFFYIILQVIILRIHLHNSYWVITKYTHILTLWGMALHYTPSWLYYMSIWIIVICCCSKGCSRCRQEWRFFIILAEGSWWLVLPSELPNSVSPMNCTTEGGEK